MMYALLRGMRVPLLGAWSDGCAVSGGAWRFRMVASVLCAWTPGLRLSGTGLPPPTPCLASSPPLNPPPPQKRTQWYDLVGVHCPMYGIDSVVDIPLPVPPALGARDGYKLQLAVEGDRRLTPWLALLGRGAPPLPVLDVVLTRSGDDLLGVTARVVELDEADAARHALLVADWRNATRWPKHLLVHYRWDARRDIDAAGGLTALFTAGVWEGGWREEIQGGKEV